MARFLQNLGSSQLSFWIGFVAGCLFWWLQIRFRKAMPGIRKPLGETIHSMRHGFTAKTESRFRNDLLHYAQGQHLAAPLFSLDEILVKPYLLTPSVEFHQGNIIEEADQKGLDIPYMPDWPTLAATFHEPRLSLPDALRYGANLILLGEPGSGKTTALAYLATILLRRSPEAGALVDYLPLLIHEGDLELGTGLPGDLLDTLLTASPLTQPRLKTVLHTKLEQHQLLLLLDGLDEQAPDRVKQVVDYLTILLNQYPAIRIVAAASLDYFDGLSDLGFVPVALAAWDDQEKAQFLHGWGELWSRFIERPAPEDHDKPDYLLINNWLVDLLANCNPFEITLKTWAAYAGDALGPSNLDAIEAYLARMCINIPKARQIFEKLALQMVISRKPIIEVKAADQWQLELTPPLTEESPSIIPDSADLPHPNQDSEVAEANEPIESSILETGLARSAQEAAHNGGKNNLSLHKILSDVTTPGLLLSRRNQQVSFVHPMIMGYLAGQAISRLGDYRALEGQTDWCGGKLAMRYYLASNDEIRLIIPLLNAPNDILSRQVLIAGSFLADAKPTNTWRHKVMYRLVNILQNDLLASSLRARAICALVSSDDPGVATLFRQLLTSHKDSVKQLAIFGIGLQRDIKAVEDLIALLEYSAPDVQQAVIRALAAFGTQPAIDALLLILKEGSEELRRTAAEVLAGFPEQGYPALKEGSMDDDLLVRRAVVYGLVRVNQSWATELLQKMQIEDGQWVVRSAAALGLEELQRANIHAPRSLPPLTETPWLIAYAGKQGMGVLPGKSARDLLRQALVHGDPDEQAAALNYLTIVPDASVIPQLYEFIYGSPGNLQEAAYNALWHLSAAGVELPPPKQFGFG
jgi:HEAT repeat protein/energy-coupling factor transporter ATP-binding protein EcfA2